MNYEYEWDPDKEKANIRKHGISFQTATLVFDDPNMLDIIDTAHSTPEEIRYRAVGRVKNTLTVLAVIYTERQRIRIISARLATKKEEEAYYDDSNL